MRRVDSGRYVAIDVTTRSDKVDRIFGPAIDRVREHSAEVARELKGANGKSATATRSPAD